MPLLGLDGQAGELGDDVSARALAVVREEAERQLPLAQLADKAVRARDQLVPAVEDAVHVDQITMVHINSLTSTLSICKHRARQI